MYTQTEKINLAEETHRITTSALCLRLASRLLEKGKCEYVASGREPKPRSLVFGFHQESYEVRKRQNAMRWCFYLGLLSSQALMKLCFMTLSVCHILQWLKWKSFKTAVLLEVKHFSAFWQGVNKSLSRYYYPEWHRHCGYAHCSEVHKQWRQFNK